MDTLGVMATGLVQLFYTIGSSLLSCPTSALSTATEQYSVFNCIPSDSLLLIRRHMVHSSAITFRQILFTLLQSGDIELNPSPNTGSLHHATRSSYKKFFFIPSTCDLCLTPNTS